MNNNFLTLITLGTLKCVKVMVLIMVSSLVFSLLMLSIALLALFVMVDEDDDQ